MKGKTFFMSSSYKYYLVAFLMLISTNVFSQKISVVGRILDSNQTSLMGAGIHEQGKKSGTVSDKNGNFKLEVDAQSKLVITYIGYKTQVLKPSPKMEIILQENNDDLNEVVVIGYGSVKRKDVTTAVSTVSTKDIEQRPLVSAAQALQGKAAGISVIQPSGVPGGEMSIRVRGTTSFNGSNDPLYVVDGVPVDNLKFLAPNDIASMQVLKDASSAAIYGSRAANGVVLITTKSGSKGNAKISFNAQYGISQVANKIDVLNTQQYKELQDEIGMINLPENLTDQTDWWDETYTTGTTQNYQISAQDGNDKLKYYLSAGYQNEKGILDISYYKRYNFRVNVESNIRKWLKLSTNLTYADYTSNGGGSMGTGANRGGVVLSVINTPTYAPIMDPNKPEQYYNNFYGIGNINNPLENMARSQYDKDKENRFLASGSAVITFLPELNFKTTLALDRRNGVYTSFLDPISTQYGRTQYGGASDCRNQNTVITFDNTLNFKKNFKNHALDVMAGTSWTSSDWNHNYMHGTHFRDDKIHTLNAANKISWTDTGSGASQWKIMSYFGRLSYNYLSKYLFTANMRIDGSSRLHPDHRWGVFPSFSGAWRISGENFMKDIKWIDDLKVRVGWGQTGNQSGIGDYAYLENYWIQRIPWFEEGKENALPTISQANLRTKDLKWETTTQTNVGIDFSAFNSRLIVNLDYYYKHTKDMLMNVSLPAGAAAANSLYRNEGEMTNQGFEINIRTRNLTGAFKWNTDLNFSRNKNKLKKLNLQKIYYDCKTSDIVNDYVVRNEPGRSLGGFFGYISDGVNPETGELNYRDINGDGKISSTDRTYIGDPNPKFTYGMTNTFSWKGLNLSIFIQGSYGNDIFNASRIETEGMYDGKNQTTNVLNRWRIPGQITDVPKAGFNIRNSSYFIEDGSYLRLKELSLSYNVHCKWFDRIGITRLQPYFTATNLFTITGYSGMDPEVNQWGNSGSVQGIDWGTYPHCRTFVFGVNVEF